MFPEPYIHYLYQFHCERDYFECHEILEEFWKKDPPARRKSIWVLLIQIAVAFYHYRRQNWNGAERMFQNSLRLMKEKATEIESLGIDYHSFIALIKETLEEVKRKEKYKSVNLPIKDEKLKEICFRYAREKGKNWGASSDLNNQFLLHKHKTRDRTDVILEREKQLEKKRRSRN